MLPVIRAARPDDALAIARLHQRVWPDEGADVARIVDLLERGQRSTQVASIDGAVVAYVDGFLTHAQDRTIRWEVDLLAVDPDRRGQGTASRLLAASLIAGQVRRAAVARALVHVRNQPAQRAFQKAGFSRWPQAHRLVVSSDDVWGDPEPPPRLHLVPVWTLNYRGFWLEGELTVDSFYAGQRYRMIFDADRAGAAIPVSDVLALGAAAIAGYDVVGDYDWWHACLK